MDYFIKVEPQELEFSVNEHDPQQIIKKSQIGEITSLVKELQVFLQESELEMKVMQKNFEKMKKRHIENVIITFKVLQLLDSCTTSSVQIIHVEDLNNSSRNIKDKTFDIYKSKENKCQTMANDSARHPTSDLEFDVDIIEEPLNEIEEASNSERQATFDSNSKKVSKKFLITYEERGKLFENPNELIVREKFSIPNNIKFFLQYFDKDFDSFVDCDWKQLEYLSSNKLRVCKVRNEISENSSTNCDISRANNISEVDLHDDSDNFRASNIIIPEEDIQDNDIPRASKIIIPEEDLQDELDLNNSYSFHEKFNAQDSDLINYDIPAQYSNQSCQEEEQLLLKIQKSLDSAIPNKECIYPNTSNDKFKKKNINNEPFILPEINPKTSLGKNLMAKTTLSPKNKSYFLTLIYESFATKGIYYVGHRYQEMATAILNAYPHLSMGFNFNEAKNLWVKSLYKKFSNTKRRVDADEEEVIKRKRKKVEGKEYSSQYFEFCRNIPNYKPKEAGKDSRLIEIHKTWLQEEFSKCEKNEALINSRMDSTYQDRRKRLFSKGNTSSISLLKEYPCLRLENQAHLEVKRMFGGKDFLTPSVQAQIRQFALRINDLVSTSRNKHKDYVLNFPDMTNASWADEIILYRLIGNIALLVSDDPQMVLRNSTDEVITTPVIYNTGNSFSLCIDGENFLAQVSALKSSFLWVASFYIFNIEVPKCIRKTFELLQYLFFNITSKNFKPTQAQAKINSIWQAEAEKFFRQ